MSVTGAADRFSVGLWKSSVSESWMPYSFGIRLTVKRPALLRIEMLQYPMPMISSNIKRISAMIRISQSRLRTFSAVVLTSYFLL